MDQIIALLLAHDYPILFVVVLLEQLGLPIPATPVLLALGALAGTGNASFPAALLVAMVASVVSDLTWFELGRRRGRPVMRMLCKISLEPDFCVRRTETAFQRHGVGLLLFSKFVPGLNIAAPPVAAMVQMSRARFLAWDAAGAALWSGSFIALGYMFSKQIEKIGAFAVHMGMASVLAIAVALALFLGWKYAQRRRFLQRLRIARITPEELYRKQENGEDIVVADLRHPLDFDYDRVKVRGALRLLPEELEKRHGEIPRDRDVVLYCNCPNEATSATVAMQLRRFGITRVRPLAGGFEAWRTGGFPLDPTDSATLESQSG
ncbi:MAG: VTT domain-containing protein [Acidobacteria bacterium]|nr:VTT domain-containing protein [Acidobacteriota bacterium]